MRVILLERIPKLGLMGDLVNVKAGYARNYLLPQGKALKETPANLKFFESRRQELEARNIEQCREAEQVASRLEGQSFILIRSAADTGSLYGSVSKNDIAKATSAEGVLISRSQIDLERPIKELGLHSITISLHPEVDVLITINVARTHDEAEQQALGLTIAEITGEAEDEAATDNDESGSTPRDGIETAPAPDNSAESDLSASERDHQGADDPVTVEDESIESNKA
ncbi:MAG: 50S ribosomal protein L9 [Rhodobacteraceae bacterium]|nr:50S ribosomal protein L9 [Paracoccaceae bacterium]